MFKKVYPREKYLSKIRPFYSSDIIKVITGIRRCGKSFILKSIINELLDAGVKEKNIIYIPLDKRGFKNISLPEQLESKIEELIEQDDFYYIFIDEVQNVRGFESVVQAYMEDGYSVFITGSNSYLLSDEISTKLTGRYLNFEIYTLDFKEYENMKEFFKCNINDSIEDEFNEFIKNGGFPKSLEFEEIQAKQLYTKGIIEEIFIKDVSKRRKITNIAVFERVQSFVINNYSSIFSVSNLTDKIVKEGYATKTSTVRRYIEELKKAKIIYECNRFDLKSKKAIRRDQKYYISDLAIYFAMNVDNRFNYGPSLENLVYIFLKSNGYHVSVGRIGNFECDFIVRKQNGEYAYIQVTYTMQGIDKDSTDKIIEREYAPFRKINDGYPRYIISLDKYKDEQEGVHHINVIDLFLGRINI